MKTIIIPNTLALVLSAGILMTSCKKDVATGQQPVAVSDQVSSSVSIVKEGAATIVTLRPGADGQDTYVSKIDASSTDGDSNLNYTNDLLASKFYYNGQLATQRGYIKFDNLLSVIPSGAKIVYAILYLYGEPAPYSFPAGNSYYPGSFNPENSCLIQRVTGGNWNESTITWNNMPRTTTAGQDTIAASTSQFTYNTEVDITSLVKPIVKQGKNYGFCMRMVSENPYRVLQFSTSEAVESLRPRLVIKYK